MIPPMDDEFPNMSVFLHVDNHVGGGRSVVKNMREFSEMIFDVTADGGGNFNVTTRVLESHYLSSLLDEFKYRPTCRTLILSCLAIQSMTIGVQLRIPTLE